MDNVEAVTSDGTSAAPVDGTVVYDIARDKMCFLITGTTWLCIGVDGTGSPEQFTVDTTTSTPPARPAAPQKQTEKLNATTISSNKKK